MEQYSNLNVHGKITQKAAQGTNADDVVKYSTFNPIVVSSATPYVSGTTYYKGSLVLTNNGLVYLCKVDSPSSNDDFAITGKVYTADGTTVVLDGTQFKQKSDVVTAGTGITIGTTVVGSATEVPKVKVDTYGRVISIDKVTIYPPTSAGTSGQLWKSDGSGAGVWTNQSDITAGRATNDADGNAIKTTYAKLNSPALTGTPTAPTATAGTNTDQIATTKFVKTAIDNLPEPMIFRGTVGTNGTITTLPTAAADNEGYTYKVITAGTYANQAAKVGDTFISAKTGDTTYAWTLIPSGDEPSGTVTNVATGVGLTGGPITSTGTIKAKLKSETNATYDSNNVSNTSGRQYAVVPDKTNGYLSVNVPWTDQSVTSTANHYTPATVSGNDKSASASGATAAWSIDVVKGVTLNTDGKGHVTGLSVTSGKIPANPGHYTAIPVLGASNATSNATSATANNATYMNIVENSSKSGGIQVIGSGGTSVSAKSGILTITSPLIAATDVTLADM